MKKVTLKVNNISTGQWSTLLLELNLIAKAWRSSGVKIELQAPSLKRILEAGQSNKPQAKQRGFVKVDFSRHKKDTFM
tara:strand:- start:211 stop:444 length:234 start_codon:yes stop_codon:yes gene_type:complete